LIWNFLGSSYPTILIFSKSSILRLNIKVLNVVLTVLSLEGLISNIRVTFSLGQIISPYFDMEPELELN
jgi:hypothetical protein